MKKHQIYGLCAVIVIAVWSFLEFNKSLIPNEIARWYIDVAPLFVVMTFGSYCLFKLGYDVVSFNDFPNEIEKLSYDVNAARAGLSAKQMKLH